MADEIISGGSTGGTPGIIVGGGSRAQGEQEKIPARESAAPAADPGSLSGTASAEMRPLAAFTGSGWELFTIHLCNTLFTILTLGVYSFWGKVRIRRYLWENTLILGEPLEYTGTGGELFRSFLAVMLLSVLGMAAFYACSMYFPFVAPVALYAVLVPLGHFASYQALRYRLTRSRWRGIRGNMDGSSARYAVAGSGYTLLTFLTLFICLPLQTARLTARRCNAALFGSRRFRFSGASGPLYASWLQSYVLLGLLLAGAGFLGYGFGLSAYEDTGEYEAVAGVAFVILLACIPLVGIMSVIYRAAVVRWLFANLAYGDMRFDARSYTAWRLFTLMLGNGFLLVFTLGLAYPWTEIRSLRFFLSSIRHTGDPGLEELLQDTLPDRSRGEGLLDALDLDLAI